MITYFYPITFHYVRYLDPINTDVQKKIHQQSQSIFCIAPRTSHHDHLPNFCYR